MAQTFRSFRVLVLTASFLGSGAAGRLVPAGDEVLLDLPLAKKDIVEQDADGDDFVAVKQGEPIVGANLQIIGPAEDGATGSVPAGLPPGAISAGNGNWLVPVGNGITFELWQPGDPTSDLSRASPDAFKANREEAEASPVVDPRFDGDGNGGVGGSLSNDDLITLLNSYGVEIAAYTPRPDLMRALSAEKAKRAAPPEGAEPKTGSGSGSSEPPAPGQSRAEITKELDELGVAYKPVGSKTDDLAKLLADEKAKRAQG